VDGARRVRSNGQADSGAVILLAPRRATNGRGSRGGWLVAWAVLVRCARHGVVVFLSGTIKAMRYGLLSAGGLAHYLSASSGSSAHTNQRIWKRAGGGVKWGERWVIGSRLGGRRLMRNGAFFDGRLAEGSSWVLALWSVGVVHGIALQRPSFFLSANCFMGPFQNGRSSDEMPR
jgi:hypothetical protein